MSAPVEILMAVFPDRPRAEVTIDALKEMGKRGDIKIIDAAMVEKDLSGKVKIDEVKELTTRGGIGRGALVGGALGLIFPPSILASAVVGGVAGGLFGKMRDTGIKKADLQEAGAELQPGQAGVIAIVEATWAERLVQAMAGHEKLARLTLEADEAAVIVGDPETGSVVAAGWTTIDEGEGDDRAPAAATAAGERRPPPRPSRPRRRTRNPESIDLRPRHAGPPDGSGRLPDAREHPR